MSGSTPADVLTLTVNPDDALALMGNSNRVVLDHFAGPGGWSTGIADLLHDAGLIEVALEWDASACLTRIANGHVNTLRADVAAYPLAPFLGRVLGYIASPPCQTFSMAGGGAGRVHATLLCECVRDVLLGTITYDEAMLRLAAAGALDDKDGNPDPRNGLILIPARVIRALLDHDGHGPTDLEWVALEQVPPAGVIFDAYATALRQLGFSVVAPVINAADYGVPQTRDRKFVIASRRRRVTVPEPTHAKGGEEVTIFGPGRLAWISMARALGWLGTVAHKRGAGMAERHGDRRARTTDEPAPTITGGTPRRLTIDTVQTVELVANARTNATRRTADEPAPTITGGHDHGERRFVAHTVEAGQFLLDRRSTGAPVLDVGVEPCPTITGAAIGRGVWAPITGASVTGDGVRITEAEGGVLQGFPFDYVWEGASKGKRWEQIGNVVCPPVARRVVAELLGVEHRPAPWHAYAWDADA